MVFVFILGYFLIAVEHKIKIDKAAIALLTGGVLWVLYIMLSPLSVPEVFPVSFQEYIHNNSGINVLSLIDQCKRYIVEVHMVESLGEISETLFFLLGAMTIVELIDVHGGFSIITDRITTRNKRRLLVIIAFLTFFMSSVLDNLTTSIVMVMLLRKIIPNYKERWIFASMIIIAANSGGAWSPIGDVTTIMLWVDGKISTAPLMTNLFIPSLISMVVPLLFASRMVKGEITSASKYATSVHNPTNALSDKERTTLFSLGVLALVFVPVFKYLTHLPPFVGVLIGLSFVWIYTEYLYQRKPNLEEKLKHRVTSVLKRVDSATILFFLGILLAVSALQGTGLLNAAGQILNDKIHNVYAINIIIGVLSSIVDNVPLVAVAMGMYPVVDPATLSTVADAAFLQSFVVDGSFWIFLAYCAGVGGSILIIGSVSGVVVMGIEKISFNWYFKNISLLAFAGYIAGALSFILIDIL